MVGFYSRNPETRGGPRDSGVSQGPGRRGKSPLVQVPAQLQTRPRPGRVSLPLPPSSGRRLPSTWTPGAVSWAHSRGGISKCALRWTGLLKKPSMSNMILWRKE